MRTMLPSRVPSMAALRPDLLGDRLGAQPGFWRNLLGLGMISAGFLLMGVPEAQAVEPGVPALEFDTAELFTELSVINGEQAPDYHGTAFWYNGHLGIVYAKGMFEGGLSLFDITDPRDPVLVGQGNHPLQREGHSTGFIQTSTLGWLAVSPASNGINLWDLNDPTDPHVAYNVELPGIIPSDYDLGTWWVAVQAPYVYVAGSFNGLYVVDLTDPARGKVINQLRMDGGFRCGSLYVAGNYLVQFSSEGLYTRFFDISDPGKPALVKEVEQQGTAYAAHFNGGYLYLARESGGLELMDVRDLQNPKTLSYIHADGGGAYLTVQDDAVHLGNSNRYYKIDAKDKTRPLIVGSFEPDVSVDYDTDFASHLGNLTVVSDDHVLTQLNVGSRIVAHDTLPDTLAPRVTFVSPANGATNVPLTSRIGVTMSDQILVTTATQQSFIVRKVGGTQATCTFSVQQELVNCWPQVLDPESQYEVIIAANGMRDWAGNPVATQFRSTFTTGPKLTNPPIANGGDNVQGFAGETVSMSASRTQGGVGTLQYSWDPGDGTAPSSFSTQSAYSHVYSSTGHYNAILTVKDSLNQTSTDSVRVTVVARPLAVPPTHSSTLAYDPLEQVMWVVNPDTDTVTAVDALLNTVMKEIPVGTHPTSAAMGADETVWVTNLESGDVSVIDTLSLQEVERFLLQPGARPVAVVADPQTSRVYVSLEGLGEVWCLDALSGLVLWESVVGPSPRGLAVVGESIYVTRFLSPASRGEVYELNRQTGSLLKTWTLAESPGPDNDTNGRGIPNYLAQIVPSPDGTRLYIPSIKQNTSRGLNRDGQALTFESTNRAILSMLNRSSGAEDLDARLDFDNRDHASAIALSPYGDYGFVTLQGSQGIMIIDLLNGQDVGFIPSVGHAPAGVAVTSDGQLFIHNYMSRNVVVYDVSNLEMPETVLRQATIRTIGTEKLSAEVVVGKRVFYNAVDTRMSRDSYISCAGCHLDGGSDARVWDFTDRGEGFRRTTMLRGRSGMMHGPVHWTANFDEIQDFENDIRNAFKGTGFLSDADWSTGTRSSTLGDKKAGLSPELDALALYVASLSRSDESPHRTSTGALSASATRGRDLFRSTDVGCATCHSGPHFTDSLLTSSPSGFVLHDVGTLSSTSGQRMGQPLTGLDTPTLKGVWNNGPYLHDGSAPTLRDVLVTRNTTNKHGKTTQLSSSQLQDLEAYLMAIDARSGSPVVVNMTPGVGSSRKSVTQVLLTFSSYPSGSTVSASSVKITNSAGTSVTGTYATDRDTIRFTPTAALPAGTYTVSVTSSLKSQDGDAAVAWTGSFTVGDVALVSNVKGWNGRTYTLKSGLKKGSRIYTDSDDMILRLPSSYNGLPFIQTASGDRDSSRPVLMTFELTAPAKVYVAVDRRLDCLPGWLSEFTPTGETLSTTNLKSSPMPLYVARFPAGKVLLGGNRADCPGRDERQQFALFLKAE